MQGNSKGNTARTNTQEPRPCAGKVDRNQQMGYQWVKHEYTTPHVEGVVSIVRQNEWVMDPEKQSLI